MKRKKADSDDNCIIHFGEIEDESFTYLKDVKDPLGRLTYLQSVKQKRLALPENSSQRFTKRKYDPSQFQVLKGS